MEHNETVKIIKCDRCGKVLPLGSRDGLNGDLGDCDPDLIIKLTDLVNIEYIDLCNNCTKKAVRLFRDLGKIDISKRGRRLKKG